MRMTLSEYSAAARDDTLLRQWDAERNGALKPEDVAYSSDKRVFWRCAKGHQWQVSVRSRTQGGGCPVCANRAILRGYNDLATTHPALASEWDNERNAPLQPTDVFAGSLRRVWWVCGENRNHRWRASIADRAGRGSGCPICQGRMVLAGDNDLQTRFPLIAAEWDREKNCLSPDEAAAYSSRIVFWRCPLGHSYSAAILSRTAHGSGCPYCSNRKVLPGFNDLATYAPDIAAQWHPTLNGALTPQMLTGGSRQKVWWECEERHVWRSAVYSRTGPKKCGCPICAGQYRKRYVPAYDLSSPSAPQSRNDMGIKQSRLEERA